MLACVNVPRAPPEPPNRTAAMILTASNDLTPTTSLVSSPADVSFHSWCGSVGIGISPSVKLVTTKESVAGRGVFSVEPLEEGESIVRIPTHAVFHPRNAASVFPDEAKRIRRHKKKALGGRRDWITRLWGKMLRREFEAGEGLDGEFWNAELTSYALVAVEEDHPWSTWISQWQRDDPTHRLISSCPRPDDEKAISATADELRTLMPDLSHLHLQAALAIRLGRFEEHRRLAGLSDDARTAAMYSVLGSRAIDLGGDVVGVLPFFDMINHSLEPNLALSFDGDSFELVAKRAVGEGEELLLQYTRNDEEMDETNALWALVQWGIPTARADYIQANDGKADSEL